jgi:N-acetyltransferase 10
MKKIEKKIKTGSVNINEDDPFELFIASTNIRYTYYHETHKILGLLFFATIVKMNNTTATLGL